MAGGEIGTASLTVTRLGFWTLLDGYSEIAIGDLNFVRAMNKMRLFRRFRRWLEGNGLEAILVILAILVLSLLVVALE